MKKLIMAAIFAMALNLPMVMAQNTVEDLSRLSIKVYQPSKDNIPEEARKALENKLVQLITNNGIADSDFCDRFIITAKADIVNKDIILGSPSRVSEKLDVTIMIGDVIENKIYNSEVVSVTGVGLNENKALIMAFKAIKGNSPTLSNFVQESKKKILDYYANNIDRMIKDAYRDVEMQNFDKALADLSRVPSVCGEAYDKCREAIIDIFTRKIDSEGEILLKEAKGAWAKSQDEEGASDVLSILNQINVLAACQPEVDALIKEINKSIKADRRRRWEFELQKYNDAKRMEEQRFEFEKQKYADDKEFKEKKYADDKEREARNFDAAQKSAEREYQFRTYQFSKNVELKSKMIDAAQNVAVSYLKASEASNNYHNADRW